MKCDDQCLREIKLIYQLNMGMDVEFSRTGGTERIQCWSPQMSIPGCRYGKCQHFAQCMANTDHHSICILGILISCAQHGILPEPPFPAEVNIHVHDQLIYQPDLHEALITFHGCEGSHPYLAVRERLSGSLLYQLCPAGCEHLNCPQLPENLWQLVSGHLLLLLLIEFHLHVPLAFWSDRMSCKTVT